MSSMTVPSQLPDTHDRSANKIIRYLLYTGPASYATGGDPVLPDDVGMTNVEAVIPVGMPWDGSGTVRILVWDYVNDKLVWFVPNTGAQVAAAVSLSGFTCIVMVIGH
jgi:hypothetical protein